MRINNVDATTVLPERRFGFGDSTCTIIRLETDEGHVGLGEIPDIEEPDVAPDDDVIAGKLAEFLVGRDPRDRNQLFEEMYDSVEFGPFDFHSFQQLTLGAIDTAIHDLVGRHYDMPVHRLLGGSGDPVQIAWVAFTRQSEDELDALREEIREKVEEGFDAFKLKVGEVDPELDRRRIETVRDVAGEDATVLLDAQGIWTAEEAIENIQTLAPAGVDGVETPVGHPDRTVDAPGYYYDIPLLPSELARVRQVVDVPLIEHVLDPAFGLELVTADAVDVFTVEVCSGGIHRASQILDIAASAGLDARLGSTVELGPGTAAATVLASASSAITYPCDLVGPALYRDSVLTEPIEYVDGRLAPREEPGYGVTIQEEGVVQ